MSNLTQVNFNMKSNYPRTKKIERNEQKSPVSAWRLVQGVPRVSPYDGWDGLQHPHNADVSLACLSDRCHKTNIKVCKAQ